MRNIIKSVLNWLSKHKVISLIIALVFIGIGGWWYTSANKTAGKVSYVTSPVKKGTIVVSISGSGQVSASNQIDLKSKVSENVVYVGVKNGQQVRAGTLLMEFDTTNTQKAVRNAQLNLDNAKLALQKLAGDNSTAAPLNKQQAQDNLAKAYNDGFNTISNTFLDLSAMITDLDSTFFKNINSNPQDINYYINYIKSYYSNKVSGANNYADSANAKTYLDKANTDADNANNAYQKAHSAYDKNFYDYKLISRNSDATTIESMMNETYVTTQDISDAVKNINTLIQFYLDTLTAQSLAANSVATSQLATLNTYTGKINTDLSNLLSVQDTIKNNKTAITNSDLDLQSQNLSLRQAENALTDAKDNLANCYIYAPFSGIVANVVFNRGDAVSAGTVALTLITNQSITKIPFNEVDITKIKVGQKAVLTFDAIDALTIAGQVSQIDTLGTVTQGVVNYNVELVFDASQTEVKPGMSVNASIITDVKQDVLTVPNSAVKTAGGLSYVQVLVNGQPQRKTVQTGLVNDTDTEITGGLLEGENVITQTITSSVATGAQSTSSIRIPGITGGGGGGFGGGRGGN